MSEEEDVRELADLDFIEHKMDDYRHYDTLYETALYNFRGNVSRKIRSHILGEAAERMKASFMHMGIHEGDIIDLLDMLYGRERK